MTLPDWICETHLRELDDLETSGERGEAKEILEELTGTGLWCQDCKDNKTDWIHERTREWAYAHRLGEMK
jgi:hypothetical protein